MWLIALYSLKGQNLLKPLNHFDRESYDDFILFKIGKHYLQVPVLANKKLFASTSCLVHYPRGRGNKTAYWKSCIGSWERFGAYIYIGRGTCAYPIRLKMVRSAKIKTIIYQKFIDLVDHSKYPALHWTIIGLNGTVGNGSVSLVS